MADVQAAAQLGEFPLYIAGETRGTGRTFEVRSPFDGSLVGVVHNALLLADPERSVVRGPFRPAPRSVAHGELALSPKPAWFVTNRRAATTGRRLVEFTANPGWARLPRIFASALRG